MNEQRAIFEEAPRPSIEEVLAAAEKGIILDWADNPTRYRAPRPPSPPPDTTASRRRNVRASVET